jgi:hypothetical protein
MRLNRIAFFATLLSILCLGASFKVWAADDEIETYGMPESHDFIKHRSYIGVFGTSADIDNNNDFSGYNGYIFGPIISGGVTSNYELDYVPAINRNFGFAGVAGHREGPWAIEVSYWYSNHTASLYSTDATGNPVTVLSTTGVLTTLNFDLKRYFFTSIPTQPFIDLGMNMAFLSSHNTSMVLNPNVTPNTIIGIGDQTESGFGLNLGAGLEIYLGDGFSLVGGAVQRFTSFAQSNGQGKINLTPTPLNDAANATGALEGNGINFYVGTTVGFDE